MKMAKASEADLKMALDLAQMLEGFERGYFPSPEDAEEPETFERYMAAHCERAMELILDKLCDGSLFRVVFGMLVLLDPRNEIVDPDLHHLDHHPKVRMHDELVGALRELRAANATPFPAYEEGQAAQDAWAERRARADAAAVAILAKVEGR